MIAGFLKDIFSITDFGVSFFSFLALGCIAGIIRDKIFKESKTMQFFLSVGAVFLATGIYYIYLAGFLKCTVTRGFFYGAAIKGLYTGCFAPAIFFIFSKMFKLHKIEDSAF